MLSQRALEGKSKYSIRFKDIQSTPSYIKQVKAVPGITVKAKSKWLNAIHVQPKLR
jgi:hypothetical protein